MKHTPTLLALLTLLTMPAACRREPMLHLFDGGDISINLPVVKLNLETYWDYQVAFEGQYDWHNEWYYGWDETDQELFGPIGYMEPGSFQLRRYYTASTPAGPHNSVVANTVRGNSFKGRFNWGFWDVLVWSDITTSDGVQSLIFDEQSTLERVTAYTNQTMSPAFYQAPRYTHSFYQPEDLFAAYDRSIEVNRDLRGFVYDPENDEYVLRLNMTLQPITYIYLTQVILRHNRNRIVSVDGQANLSGFGRTTNINTGTADNDPVTVYYHTRFKPNCDMKGETVDIVGGRLMTFGICGMNANQVRQREEVKDDVPHFLDLTMQFNNGMDSTFVFDVTEQVRNRWKGGVITVELDMDTVPVPSRSGGSAFDAVVKDFEDGGTHEFDL